MNVEAEVAAVRAITEDEDTGRAVQVTWTDSGQALHGWQSEATIREHVMPVIETVGIWIGESDDMVMVAGSRDETNCNWGECQLIWKPAISRKEWLT